VIRSLAVVLVVVCDLVRVLFRSRPAVMAENLLLRRQLALYVERKTRRRRPTPAIKVALFNPEPFLSLDERSGDCEAGYVHPLAPGGIPSLVALEVSARWPPTAAHEPTRAHRADGSGESELGRRKDRRRVVSQTGSAR
jgi:hypothetical protein